ncbi:MAG TPA: SWIM zinc finger family protein, partial [Tepidisphaeraceae bacterium]|nr:SWIM zinc finger family protein [Tepidisphaeraceae bacterium]
MALIELLAGDFEAGVRVRGKNYFERGAVDILRQTHRSVSAAVQADRTHLVEIDWDSGLLEYECSCDDFQYRGHSCKHIWAALLQAQSSGRLPNPQALAEMAGEPVGDNGNGDSAPRAARKMSVWKRRLGEIRSRMVSSAADAVEPWPAGLELLYVIDGEATENDPGGVIIDLAMRFRRRDGLWNRPRGVRRLRPRQIATLPDPADRQILQMLCGADCVEEEVPRRYRLQTETLGTTLKAMCQTGRCRLRGKSSDAELIDVTWDDNGPWEFVLQLARHEQEFWRVDGSFMRGEDRMGLDEAKLIVRGGAICRGRYVELAGAAATDLIRVLRRGEKLAAPISQGMDLLAELFSLPGGPKVEVPDSMGLEQIRASLQPVLKIRAENRQAGPQWLQGE